MGITDMFYITIMHGNHVATFLSGVDIDTNLLILWIVTKNFNSHEWELPFVPGATCWAAGSLSAVAWQVSDIKELGIRASFEATDSTFSKAFVRYFCDIATGWKGSVEYKLAIDKLNVKQGHCN